jgi:molybdopterin molybdotransferase
MGKEFLNLMEPEEVKNILDSLKLSQNVELINLRKCLGRVLAEDIYSLMDLPPFDRVTMDGYALRAQDTFGASEDNPKILELVEVVRAGDIPQKKVLKGCCVEVGTGAPLPPQADAVVMLEYTEISGNQVFLYQGAAPGENIAKQGSDIEMNHTLLKRHTILTPDKIGVLSAMGMEKVPVYSQIKVGIISTGNEIVPCGEELSYGKIYDVNSQTVASAVESCGCIPIDLQIVRDDFETLKNAIKTLSDADVIITSGGTSAGAGDVLRAVVEEMGEVLVHGIALKPGKPTLIGLIKDGVDKVLIGLPGYPVAALVVFESLIAPFLRRNSGLASEEAALVKLRLSRRFHPSRGRTHQLLVKIQDGLAIPILKDSGAITALAEADGYIEIPKNIEIIEKGTMVDVRLFSRKFNLF